MHMHANRTNGVANRRFRPPNAQLRSSGGAGATAGWRVVRMSRRPDVRIWALLVLGSTGIGVLFAVQSWLTAWAQGVAWGGFRIAGLQVAAWWGWLLLSPIIFAVCRRAPITSTRLARPMLVHGATALVTSVAHAALLVFPTRWLLDWNGAPRPPVLDQMVGTIAYRFVSDLLQYALIVAGWHAFVYHRQMNARALAEARLRAELLEAELRELRTQLQPHFLTNALNAIAAYIHGEPDVAEAMVVRLSRYLRSVLRASQSQRVPLHVEIGLVEEFLAIHRLRFGDRLRVAVEVDGSARTALVPVMLLQPLVENAVTHGVGTHIGRGSVRITARRERHSLCITVEDNGDGAETGPPWVPGRGTGLSNTEKRLARLYGGQYVLEIMRTDGGTQVRVSLPFEAMESAS
jgi:two-component system, LytTR family, sensor kinase